MVSDRIKGSYLHPVKIELMAFPVSRETTENFRRKNVILSYSRFNFDNFKQTTNNRASLPFLSSLLPYSIPNENVVLNSNM